MKTKAPEALDRSRHAAPQVFERLREKIVNLELTPGSVVSRAELAAQYGLSQTPVRDALIRLGEEGLIDIFPQHATVVSRINLKSATQAHFLRRAVELEVVRVLAEHSDAALIARLRAIIERQRQLCDLKDYPEFLKQDQALHREMYEAVGVTELWDLIRRLSGHIDRLRHLHLPMEGKTLAVLRDHIAIVDAIAASDPLAAQAALTAHLSGTLARIEEVRQKHPEFVT